MSDKFYFIGEDDHAAYALPDGLDVWNLGVGMTGVVKQGENGDLLMTLMPEGYTLHFKLPSDGRSFALRNAIHDWFERIGRPELVEHVYIWFGHVDDSLRREGNAVA